METERKNLQAFVMSFFWEINVNVKFIFYVPINLSSFSGLELFYEQWLGIVLDRHQSY